MRALGCPKAVPLAREPLDLVRLPVATVDSRLTWPRCHAEHLLLKRLRYINTFAIYIHI
jgi:hypothetical protein